jgi:hypothetical protein
MNKYAWLTKQFLDDDSGGAGGGAKLVEVTDMNEEPPVTTVGDKPDVSLIQASTRSSEEDINEPAQPKNRFEEPINTDTDDQPTPEVKPPVEKPVAKAADPAVKPTDEVFDPEKAAEALDKAEPRPGSHPKTIDDFRSMKATTRKALDFAKSTKAEIETLKQQLAQGPKPEILAEKDKELETLRNRVKELSDYEFMVKPEASEYVKREFDSKMDKTSESIYDMLKSIGVKDDGAEVNGVKVWGINEIKKAGNPLKYADFAWWQKNVFPAMDPLKAERLKGQLMNLAETEEAKKSAIAGTPERIKEVQAKLQEQNNQKSQEWMGEAKKRADELAAQLPYGKPIPITDKMTPEEKANAEELNAFHEECKTLIPKLLSPQTAKDSVDIAVGFMNAIHVERQNTKMTKEITELKAKLQAAEEKLGLRKKAMNTSPGSTAPVAATKKSNDANQRVAIMSGKVSAEDIMNEIAPD